MADPQVLAGHSGGCDPRAALLRLGDDEELYREVLQRFFNDAPGFVQRIWHAIQQQRSEELHRAAHSFKGLAAMAGAENVARTAAELEGLGKAGRLDESPEFAQRLQRDLEQARVQLAPYYQ
jgi:HPt (histidine-containing phosphotransfer) domain-containing protein